MSKKSDNGNRKRPAGFVPCPTCGNDDVDTLVWDDEEGGADFVRCTVCGTRYDPISGEIEQPF
jgi:formate dehydrogenase maturation protein FdhE